jgi:peroxiredoxin
MTSSDHFSMRRTIPAIIAMALAACDAGEAPEQPPEVPEAIRLGHPAPAFRTVTLAGDTVSLDSLRGNVVIVNAWAIWCPPCIRELPDLQRLHDRYSERGLNIVGLHVGAEGLGRARTFLRTFSVDFDNSAERWDRADALLGVQRGIPRTALIDRSGTVVSVWPGPVDLDSEMIEAVLDDRHELSSGGTLRWAPAGGAPAGPVPAPVGQSDTGRE